MKQFEGHGVAMITPFTNEGLVDFEAIPKVINHLCAGSVNYIVVLLQNKPLPWTIDNKKAHQKPFDNGRLEI